MKTKKYVNGGKPPLRLDASAKKAVMSQPVSRAALEPELRRQAALRDSAMKRPLQPVYPELVVFSAANAIKSATIPEAMKTAKKFLPKKAAALFAADLAVDAAADKDREKRKK